MVETELVRSQQDEGYELLFKLEQDGIYFGTVMYDSDMVGTDGFTIICLDGESLKWPTTVYICTPVHVFEW